MPLRSPECLVTESAAHLPLADIFGLNMALEKLQPQARVAVELKLGRTQPLDLRIDLRGALSLPFANRARLWWELAVAVAHAIIADQPQRGAEHQVQRCDWDAKGVRHRVSSGAFPQADV